MHRNVTELLVLAVWLGSAGNGGWPELNSARLWQGETESEGGKKKQGTAPPAFSSDAGGGKLEVAASCPRGARGRGQRGGASPAEGGDARWRWASVSAVFAD